MSPAAAPGAGLTGEPTYDLFVSYAESDRGWAEGYLFDALDAAGIHYVSESAFELGAPRINEFERAVRASRRTLLVITPAYLADAYAPFADLLAQTFGVETGTWPVIPLTLEDAPLPPRLAMLVGLDATDPGHWAPAITALCDALGRPLPASSPPACPYPGMLSFREADAGRFFGRDADVAEMLDRLRLHHFLAVIGPSGSGKSSVVLAGLVPALRRSGLFGAGDWRVVVVRPGATPCDALRTAVGDTDDPAAAVERALDGQPGADRLLLVCDQFEEAFAIGRLQVAEFQEQLAALAARSARCWVVITVRADFYADVMASPLWPEIHAHRVEVAPLADGGLRAAIVRPAAAVGVHVEPALVERLVADAAGEPGVLPLVQEALVLSWEGLARRFLPVAAYESIGQESDGSHDRRTGIQAAMASRADAALAELPASRQDLARRVFVRLVEFGQGRADTRRQQHLDDLAAAGDPPGELAGTVAVLVDDRLLTTSGGDGDTDRRVDLAHEALITGWPTLRGWLDERREAEQVRRRLEARADDWVRLGRGRGGLLDEIELVELERWLAGPDAAALGVDPACTELAVASRAAVDAARAARRRRLIAVVGSLVAVLAVVTVLALLAVRSRQAARDSAILAEARGVEAENRREEAEEHRLEAEGLARSASSRQLAADAVAQLDDHLDRGMLLAVRGYRTEATEQASSALLASLEASPRAMRFLDTETDDVWFSIVTFTDDGHVAALVNDSLLVWDAATGKPVAAPAAVLDSSDTALGGFGPLAEFSANGRLLAVPQCPIADEAPCAIQLWDVATARPHGDPIGVARPPGDPFDAFDSSSIAFSPDGKLLAFVSGVSVVLWDIEQAQPLGEPLPSGASSMAFSPDSRTLAVGLTPADTTGESVVSLWEVATQDPLVSTTIDDAGEIVALAFTPPNGSALAVGFVDGEVRTLNTSNLSPAGDTWRAPSSSIRDIAFSPDGTTLAASSYQDNHVSLWTMGKAEPEQLIGHTDEVNDVAWDSDGSRFTSAGADGRLIVWGAGTFHALGGTVGWPHAGSTSAIAFDDDIIVTAGRGGPTDVGLGGFEVGRWDRVAGVVPGSVLPAGGVVALSADGRTTAVGDSSGQIVTIEPWSGAAIRPSITVPSGDLMAVALSSHGSLVASVYCATAHDQSSICDHFEIGVSNTRTGRNLALGAIDALGNATRVVFSPDGSTVAATIGIPRLGVQVVVLWDVATAQAIGQFLPQHGTVLDVEFSPKGELLAVASSDPSEHAPTAALRLPSNNITLWDVATAEQVGDPLLGHKSGVTAVAFSPNGALLASGDSAGEIRLWDVATRRLFGAPIETGAGVEVLRFGRDGTLASGGTDGRLGLWATDPESWIERLSATANRDLTTEEWAEFVGDVPYEPTCPGYE